MLRTATLALIHYAAEYCAPAWCRSAHTRLIDTPINAALRLVTGCLRSTPTDNLYALSDILPSELRRKRATLSLALRAQEPEHLLHNRLLSHPYGGHRQLKSRRPFVPAALKLLDDLNESETSVTRWADRKWNIEWKNNTSRLHGYITDVSEPPPGMRLPRLAWIRLNRLRTGIGLFHSTMHRWRMSHTAACECGAEEQIADHILTSCPRYHLLNGIQGLLTMNDSLTSWLTEKFPDI